MLSASVLVSLFTSARLPSVADSALRQPLTLLVSVLLITYTLKITRKIAPKDSWQLIVHVLPASLVFGIILSVFGKWNDGSGVLALPFRSVVSFLLSGGILPVAIGPESLLRFSLLGLSILLAIKQKRGQSTFSQRFLIGILAWIASAVVLLVPSWMMLSSSLLRGSVVIHAQDAVRSLGVMHTGSYWSSFQADRFFTGIGNEVTNASGLSTSAFLLIVGLLLCALLSWRTSQKGVETKANQILVKMSSAESLFLLSGTLAGFLIGIRGYRFSWNGVNAMAFVLMLICSVALVLIWLIGKETEHYDSVVLVALLTGGILGWPALVLVLAFLFFSWLMSLNEFEWKQSMYGRAGVMVILTLFAVALGGVVGARSPLYPHELSGWIGAWAILVAGATILCQFDHNKRKNLRIVFGISVLSTIGFLPLLPYYALGGLVALL
ncbi:MAG: hypothetical protein NUV91_09270, partial [Candidatus Omnitrophica bacterium]|nr:hypothetical protein [Candidatus Omnitrophota bacterium]